MNRDDEHRARPRSDRATWILIPVALIAVIAVQILTGGDATIVGIVAVLAIAALIGTRLRRRS
jgi:hypothetical protein